MNMYNAAMILYPINDYYLRPSKNQIEIFFWFVDTYII